MFNHKRQERARLVRINERVNGARKRINVTLNINEVKNAKPASATYKLTDGNGLSLQVSPFGIKTWHYRYRHKGREKVLTLGRYPEIGWLLPGLLVMTHGVWPTPEKIHLGKESDSGSTISETRRRRFAKWETSGSPSMSHFGLLLTLSVSEIDSSGTSIPPSAPYPSVRSKVPTSCAYCVR